MKERYSAEGYRIVSEIDHCAFWEKDSVPCYGSGTTDCFFCRYADFRTPESIRRAEEMPRRSIIYSVCQNEKNKKPASETEE